MLFERALKLEADKDIRKKAKMPSTIPTPKPMDRILIKQLTTLIRKNNSL